MVNTCSSYSVLVIGDRGGFYSNKSKTLSKDPKIKQKNYRFDLNFDIIIRVQTLKYIKSIKNILSSVYIYFRIENTVLI